MPPSTWISIAVNGGTLLGMLVLAVRWLRSKFDTVVTKKVSEPLTSMQASVDDAVKRLESAVQVAATEAQRANDRLDRHMESHNG